MADDKYLVTRTRADADERAAKAWRLRVAGGSWADIATALGYRGGAPAVHRAVSRYFGTVPQVDRDMMREIARQRGERLWLRAAAEVEKNPSPAIIRAAVSVLERAARLDGLDAPTKTELVAPSDDEFVRLVQAAARGMKLELPEEADIFDAEYVDADVVEDVDDSGF